MQTVHFIAIGGQRMSGIAAMLFETRIQGHWFDLRKAILRDD